VIIAFACHSTIDDGKAVFVTLVLSIYLSFSFSLSLSFPIIIITTKSCALSSYFLDFLSADQFSRR